MRLYLSSFRTGDRSKELRSLAGNSRAVVIANAVDNVPLDTRTPFVRHEFEELRSIGFEPTELDLRDYFVSGINVADRLEDVGLIWVTGGNVFLLRKAFKASGFDHYLLENRDHEILYGGYSAGACVVAPTLHGLEIVDDLNAIADGYSEEVIWEGLNLVPFSIAPHYKSKHPESAEIDTMVEYFIDRRIPFVALSDGEVEVQSVG